VPPAERGPEVAAFVESVQLMREACELLPLAANGRPALPAGAAFQRQWLLVLAKLVRADFLCPAPMRAVGNWLSPGLHVGAYAEHLDLSRGENAELAWALHSYNRACGQFNRGNHSGAVQAVSQIVEMLGDVEVQRAVDQQMRQLASSRQPPSLTARQLLYTCCSIVAYSGFVTEGGAGLDQLAAASGRAAAERSSEALLRLEPEQPQSWSLAALQHMTPHGNEQRALEMLLCAFRLAQQQRSDWWMMQAGGLAVSLGAAYHAEYGAAMLKSALGHCSTCCQRCSAAGDCCPRGG
jgi:hypothetical protein